ncbi:head-tail connector protein [Ruegeria jejuensis]|uniref:head-tail connector protein n=1 Tax=Ruegeria jejuensis TaxID=3233338 RepID=UPI00355B41E9
MKPVLVTPPGHYPVTREEAKMHLRVDDSDEDSLVTGLIAAVTAYLDGWSGILGRCIVTQTWQFGVSGWSGCIRLPFPDVSSVEIKYQDADNVEQTVDPSLYEVVADATGVSVWFRDGFSGPDLYDDMQEPITVSLTAGYGGSEDVPAPIKQAILLMVAHLHENRASASDLRLMEVPMAFNALVQPHRHMVVG